MKKPNPGWPITPEDREEIEARADAILDKLAPIFAGERLIDVLGACISSACVAAEGIQMPKDVLLEMVGLLYDGHKKRMVQ